MGSGRKNQVRKPHPTPLFTLLGITTTEGATTRTLPSLMDPLTRVTLMLTPSSTAEACLCGRTEIGAGLSAHALPQPCCVPWGSPVKPVRAKKGGRGSQGPQSAAVESRSILPAQTWREREFRALTGCALQVPGRFRRWQTPWERHIQLEFHAR